MTETHALPAKAIIFDFGGVISRTLFETHPLTEASLGLPSGSLTWMGPFDPATDPLWRDMQADVISERDYWYARTRELGGLVGKEWTEFSDFVKAVRGDAPAEVIRPEFLQTVEEALAAGLRLAVLSNELDLFYGADFRTKLPFLAQFDAIVDATYTGILKPDPRAYETCLAELGLTAGECVFVDDQDRNIKGAEKVGLRAVAFDVTRPAESYARVRAAAGLNPTGGTA
ncbi:HAD-IA family hydrolase [Frigidibacter oleivorans]|uniref:HAD-IA family hydrolase n=1 Tax=Frigidibacter oleivorans TaxID=2487129 RepID=UPI000F8D6C51|nr:HAD-IA family hydrolase [Frigidibacter oleivorans]